MSKPPLMGPVDSPLSAPLSRRAALGTMAVTGAGVGLAAVLSPFLEAKLDRLLARPIPGRILGAAASVGHQLRAPAFPAPTAHRSAACVIVGGGMAGLSAAWRLQKAGVGDFQLLELGDEVGGNARSGANAVSAYPWGAHYVPVPSAESTLVRELFTELKVIRDTDDVGRPIYDELYLCADPSERLYIEGRWQDGLVPRRGLNAEARRQFHSFFTAMAQLRALTGDDGRPAFAVPSSLSSRDPKLLALDKLTMAAYMAANHWQDPALLWYVNYCMRDDFGCTLQQASAWAGVHYFAARRGVAANAQPGQVLTWPAGNGWLVQQLQQKVKDHINTDCLVYSVQRLKSGEVDVLYFDQAVQQSVRLTAKTVIIAAPRPVASRLVAAGPSDASFTYAPWLVANLTVSDLSEQGGVPPAWDNVSYHGDSLGYVVATHQELRRYPSPATVLTYYHPLTAAEPAVERTLAGGRSHADWTRLILRELAPMHPDLAAQVQQIDVWVWGHGMIRPTSGFITSAARRDAAAPLPPVFFAHSDLSGLSLFEEAQDWGVKAADQAARYLQRGREA